MSESDDDTGERPTRRDFLTNGAHLCAAAIAGAAVGAGLGEGSAAGAPPASSQRFLLVGLCGSENPTRANFPFAWAAALKEAGQEVRIELAGDATVLMRRAVSDSLIPVGWPPFKEALQKVIDLKIPIFV